MAALLIPESPGKGFANLHAHLTILERVNRKTHRPAFHAGQRTIPQSIDFHRLPTARRNHPIPNLRIHPSELYAWHSCVLQAITRLNTDTVIRASHVP